MRIYRIRKFPAKLVIILLIVAIIVFKPHFLSGMMDFAFDTVLRPFKFLNTARNYIVHLGKFSGENLSLRQRLGELSVRLTRMEDIARENERLRAMLNFQKRLQYTTVIASVVGRDSTDWRKGIIIDKGRVDGIKEHMPCATANGLIGLVTEVTPHSSKVMLITDPNSRIGVLLEESRQSGVLVGLREGGCKVIYLSMDEDVKKGDKVVTAGFGPLIPKGLPVGEVTNFGTEEVGLYRYAAVRPFQDLGKIEEIMCIDVNDGNKY
ncbi:MAG: rod shape-determining protein MreC [Candidatus Omnitrophica bacterium]|nr:rod shape-determining protein MreC [Candidatus Omnitrophota bacterium]